jgi:hypothetical protein
LSTIDKPFNPKESEKNAIGIDATTSSVMRVLANTMCTPNRFKTSVGFSGYRLLEGLDEKNPGPHPHVLWSSRRTGESLLSPLVMSGMTRIMRIRLFAV